jgi:hypothetical protein
MRPGIALRGVGAQLLQQLQKYHLWLQQQEW